MMIDETHAHTFECCNDIINWWFMFAIYYTEMIYKFSEMIGQKPLIATLVPNLIGHPYIGIRKTMYKWSDIE